MAAADDPSPQRPLDLPAPAAAMGRADFILGPGNRIAFALLESWPMGWAAGKLALCGPPGSGKTHLTRIWATDSRATVLPARALPGADIAALAHGPVAVEDVARIAGHPAPEEALLHLHNLLLAEGQTLLVTDRLPPARWPLRLPDLASRMQACPVVKLEAPDDRLLGGLLVKLFADRQILPAKDVIPFLLVRMERSFEAARRIAAALDAQSLAEQRPVTRAMAARVLARLDNDPPQS
ncbi:chromosomal replication initiator DnaA [Pseudooceanicola sp. CBS1P-1]|uniref:Chromosomal replication initiator DnaA n=1 Tax=Pseudooceanicola albus TaxID=2692189 RepID=A0A6L7G302_9RHOB|nr:MULTISPECIES: chromosomal replication initiator DnaA [Pseudooceanicola]MBT9384587.1 chromosomal replication initiator DnaA [Pseudooceanicola endophyticus]MXN18289.1 chromosomal replication initiator DnaA [Pseudooceanicola albus]